MKSKILIIDDEKNLREIFSLLLEEEGYTVSEAQNGREGLKKIQTFLPDVVLLDMNLPDSSGIEVLARIKESHAACRVIIITAFGTIKTAVEATKLGAYDYLEKPIDNDELLLLISRALELNIPTLCFDEAVSPYGACRLCMVEVTAGGRKRLTASCTHPVEEGIEVVTESEEIKRARQLVLELREFHLDSSLMRVRPLREDIQDHATAVEHLHVQRLFQAPLLLGR